MKKTVGSYIVLNRTAFFAIGVIVALAGFGLISWRASARSTENYSSKGAGSVSGTEGFKADLADPLIPLNPMGPSAVKTYVGTLSPAAVNPPVASPATGTVSVSVDTTGHTLSINTAFSGLVGTTTGAHIHCCVAPGANVGLATSVSSFASFPLSVTSGTYANVIDLTLASSYNAAFVTANGGTVAGAEAALIAGLDSGLAYFDIHSSTFGGGEIRANLLGTVVDGTGSDNVLVVTATGPNSGSYTLDGGSPVAFSGIGGLVFNGLGGNDTLTINNPAGGLFAPVAGIEFNGGGQPGDNLNLLGGGGAGFSETYFVGTTAPPIGGGPGNNGSGVIRFTGPNPVDIRFTGLAPIIDTVAAASLTVNSTDAANTISITNGGVAPRLRVAVDAFEPIDFDNKTLVTINGGDGTVGGDAGDTITANYSNIPAALVSLTINGNEGNDQIDASAIGAGVGSININGQDGNDALVGSGGDNVMDGGPGDDTFIGNGGTDDVGGGGGTSLFDQIIVPGTAAGDTIALASNGSGHLLATINGVTTTYRNFLAGPIDSAGIESLIVNADAGNDAINVTVTPGTYDITLNGGLNDDQINASATIAGPNSIFYNGNEGNDTLIGGGDDERFDGGPGDDTFIGNGGTDDVGGGIGTSLDDRIIVPGTAVADTITLAVNGSGHLLATINGVTTTYRNFISGPIDSSGIEAVNVNADAGDDTINIAPMTSIGINIDGGSPVLPTQPGDTLSIDLTGTTGLVFTPGVPAAGVLTFTNRAPVSYVSIETLNNPTLPVGNGTGIDNVMIVTATGPNSGSYTLDGGPAVPFSGISSFTFNGLDGNDTFTINNPAGGLFAPTGGINFNGGGQPGDNMNLLGGGGAGFSETYFVGTTTPPIGVGPGNNGAGLIRFTGPNPVDIRFTGLAPIIDTVAVASLTVNSTDAANVISLTNGGVSPRLRAAVDAFEPIDFDNKASVFINGGDGTDGGDAGDTITINYSNAPAALVSLTINGNEGDDLIAATGTVIGPASISLNGNGGNDSLIGNAGNNTFDGGPGDDTFIGNGGTDNVGGGAGGPSLDDRIIVPGTAAADTITLTVNGSGHLLATINGVTTTYRNFISGPIDTAGIEAVNVNADAGNDTVNVAPMTSIGINVDGGSPVSPAQPGDALSVDFTGTTGLVFTPGVPAAGVFTFTNSAPVSYVSIERPPISPTTTTLVSLVNPSTFGQLVVFRVAVVTVPAGGTANGRVTFFDGGNPICSNVVLNAQGQANCVTGALSVGDHFITAEYSGSATTLASSADMVNNPQVVRKANATCTVTPYNVTYDGASHTATGSCTGIGGVALTGLDLTGTTHTNAGSYTDTWTFTDVTGNYNNQTGTVVDNIDRRVLTVTADNKTRVFGSPNPGLTFQITGFLLADTPTTTVTGTPSLTTTATQTIPVGTYPITAALGTLAAGNYTFTFVNGTLTVTQAATTTTITNAAALAANPTAVGQAYAVNWLTSPVAPSTGVPTGTVTVSDGTDTCTAAVGAGTCNLVSTTAGSKNLTATYGGDANMTGSSSTATQPSVPHTVQSGNPNTLEGDLVDANGNPAGGGGVLPNDVTVAALAFSNQYTFTGTQFQRADVVDPVCGNGRFNLLDVNKIAEWSANLLPAPVAACGDTVPLPGTMEADRPDAVGREVRVVSQTSTPGATVVIPIVLESQGDETALSFNLTFPVGTLTYSSFAVGAGAPNGTAFVLNESQLAQGRLGIVLFGAGTYATGTRVMANVTFTVAAGATAGTYPVGFFTDQPVPTQVATGAALATSVYTPGAVIITTTAAGVRVSGRVTTPNGQGLRNATVVMTDSEGKTRTATTSSFGIYTFDDVEAGNSYVMRVTARRYRFGSRVVNVSDNLADVDFVGLE